MTDGTLPGLTPPPAKRGKRQPSDGSVQRCFDAYVAAYRERWGIDPIVKWGKNGRQIKDLIEQVGVEDVLALLGEFFTTRDPAITRGDYSLDFFALKAAYLRLRLSPNGHAPVPERTSRNIEAAERATRPAHKGRT